MSFDTGVYDAAFIASAKKAQTLKETLLALGANIAKSKTRERLPSAFQTLHNEAVKNSAVETLYIKAEDFNQVFMQQGLTAEQIAQAANKIGAKNYMEAAQTDGDIVFDGAKLIEAFAATKDFEVLTNYIRNNPEDLSAADIKRITESLNKISAENEKLLQDSGIGKGNEEYERIYEKISKEMAAVAPPKYNKKQWDKVSRETAALLTPAIITTALRQGKPIQETADRLIPNFISNAAKAKTEKEIITEMLTAQGSANNGKFNQQIGISYSEIAQKAQMPRMANTTSEAAEIAKSEVKRDVVNEKLGVKGHISNESIAKMNSDRAVKKSISPEAHAKAVANIDILFENALFDMPHSDKNQSEGIKNIHRLGAVMEFKGEFLPVKITVKEYSDKLNLPNKVYSVEAVEIEKPARQFVSAQKEQITPIAGFNETRRADNWSGQPSPIEDRLPPNTGSNEYSEVKLLASTDVINEDSPEIHADFNTKIQEIIEKIKKGDTESKFYFQRAWHGTGVKGITEFSNDKIGSGEGAQAFGWGHYASGRRGIGEWYRKKLSATKIDIGGTIFYPEIGPSLQFDDLSVWHWYVIPYGLARLLYKHGRKGAISYLETLKKQNPHEIDTINNIDRGIKLIEEATIYENTGQLYEVEIPESKDFLQWDKPIEQQSEKVKKALLKLGDDLEKGSYSEKAKIRIKNFQNITRDAAEMVKSYKGADIYNHLETIMEVIEPETRSDKAASLKLLEYGILGNEYPAGTYSGNTDSEARNFVLFDPKYIEIKKTYYQSGIDERLQSENFKKWFGDWERNKELQEIANWLFTAPAVSEISGNEFKKSDIDIVTQVEDYFKSIGGKVERAEIGEIELNRAGVKSSIAHGLGRDKAAAFMAVADIIKRGKISDHQLKWKGRSYDTFVIDAPIKIDGKDYIGEVIVKQKANKTNEYYLHEVEIKEKAQGMLTRPSVKTGIPQASRLIITQLLQKSNENVSKVVDGQGRPLIVYHGSRTGGGFFKFGKFSFFIDNKDVADIFGKEAGYTLIVNGKKRIVDSQAMDIIRGIEMYEDEDWFLGVNFAEWLNDDSAYSERVADKIEELREYDFIKDPGEIKELRIEKNDNLYAVYLDIKNPLVLDAKGAEWYPADKDEPGKYFVPERYIKEAIEGGYDGLIVKNIIEGGLGSDNSTPATDYIVFNPKQIKSVDNEGGFSRKSANIYKQGNRAMLELTSEGKPLVTLFEDADASSVIHEFGHIWLNEGLRFLEEYEAAGGSEAYLKEQGIERQYINDLIFLRKHLGIEAGAEITRQQHEVFARSFEAYLFEGKAPTMELRRVFENFRRWLLKIYRTVLSLEAPLNDEIRGVFDRMLATEEEIEIAESMKDYAKFGEEVLDEPDKKRLETITETAKMKAFEIMLKEQMSKYGVKEISKMKKMRQEAIKKGIDNFAKEAIYSAQKSIEETFKSPAKEIAQKYRDRMTELDEAKGNDIKRWYQSDSGLAERIKKLESRDSKKYQPHIKLTQQETKRFFKEIGHIQHKDLQNTRIPAETAGKILRQQGFDTSTIIKYLPELYENSILLNSIPEKEYQQQHKKHKNIALWHNTLNKFKIGNDEFYIRFTVTESRKAQNKKGPAEKFLHSTFVSDIKLYKAENEKDVDSNDTRLLTGAEESTSIDGILKEILDEVNGVHYLSTHWTFWQKNAVKSSGRNQLVFGSSETDAFFGCYTRLNTLPNIYL